MKKYFCLFLMMIMLSLSFNVSANSLLRAIWQDSGNVVIVCDDNADGKYKFYRANTIDGEYEYIGKNQISNMGYYIDNYFLIPVRPDDITPKIVKTVSDDSISEFYDYCNENNITMDDLIKYLVRQFSYVDDEPFEDNDLESISEMIEEDLEPLGFKFSQKLIKGAMMPAYEKMAELE